MLYLALLKKELLCRAFVGIPDTTWPIYFISYIYIYIYEITDEQGEARLNRRDEIHTMDYEHIVYVYKESEYFLLR